jgi:hypothetical protein
MFIIYFLPTSLSLSAVLRAGDALARVCVCVYMCALQLDGKWTNISCY